MKQRIYLSLCCLAMVVVTACGKKSEQPPIAATPSPVPITAPVTPSPVTTTPATPTPAPLVQSSPVPVKIRPIIPIPAASIPVISAFPTSIYPTPTPIAIPTPSTPVQTAPVQTKTNSKPDAISKLNIPTNPAQKITTVGIGVAKIGMSLKELKEQAGSGFKFPIKTNFLVDFDAIAVTKAGVVQYYIPYPSGTQFTDADRIQHLMTDNPDYRTEQGVGPGTSIKQATSVYGGATLSMSKENESREFVNFTQHPTGLAFRPKPVGSHNFAGEYPESNDEYLKTQKYDRRAAIGQITVSCAEEQCEQDH